MLTHIVERCCRLKADVVEQDEREETGVRAILNYGHTFCHALRGGHRLRRAAARRGRGDRHALRRRGWPSGSAASTPRSRSGSRTCLESFGLPTALPEVSHEELIELMYHDKKVERGKLRFVLPSRLGHVEVVRDVSSDDIRTALGGGD